MDIVARSHPGRLRQRNEDCVAVDAALGVAVLADGMGGLQDGHVASRRAVDAMLAHLRQASAPGPEGFPLDVLEAALAAANDHVRRQAGPAPMGTTGMVVSLGDGRGCISHVGDSRAYLARGSSLSQLTRDHSLVQEMVELGVLRPEEVRQAPNRNVITRALGIEATVTPDSTSFVLAAEELVLLCSDGLWDMLDDGHIAALVSACGPGRRGLEACADALVDAANEAGGHDNVSVVLARG